MKPSKHQAEALAIAQFQAQARRLAGAMSENQMRFLKARQISEETLEPVGRLAGVHS